MATVAMPVVATTLLRTPATQPDSDSVKLVLPEHQDNAGKTVNGVLQLSTIDHIAPRSYCPRLHCFSLPEGCPKDVVFSDIQQGLRRTLTELPHFGGRVVGVDSPANGVGIVLDGLGAVLYKKDYEVGPAAGQWTSGSFDDLCRSGFPASKLPFELLMPERDGTDPLGERCTYVQANFIPGGLLLAVYYHHVASDAPGYSVLFESWARHVKALSLSNQPAPLQPPPREALDRSRLSRGAAAMKLEDFPGWKLAGQEETTRSHENDEVARTVASEIYHISEKSLRQLKFDISQGQFHVSTNEACASMLWRHVTRARKFANSRHSSSVLSLTCNTRPRLGLHPQTVGNACEPNAYTRLPLDQVCADDMGSLNETIKHIRQSIALVNEESVDRLIGLLNAQPSMTHLTWNCDRWPGPDMLVSNMLNAGWNEPDWGVQLGRSAVSRIVRPNSTSIDGRCYILPRPRDKTGVEILLTYPSAVLAQLRSDSVFCGYFEPRG